MLRLLASLLLFTSAAIALPSATADAKAIAQALPEPCAMVLTVQMPPAELLAMIGRSNLASLAEGWGVPADSLAKAADGRAFMALYDEQLVVALGVKDPLQPGPNGRLQNGWLMNGDPATLDHFLGEPSALADSVRFSRLAEHWPGGTILLYSGDLITPSPRFLYNLEGEDDLLAEIRQMLSFAPPCPQLCAGVINGQLEAWVAPLAPKVPAGQAFTSSVAAGKFHRQWVPGLYEQGPAFDQLIGAIESLPLSLPLQWKLFIGARNRLEGSESSGLPLASSLASLLVEQTPLLPFQETLQSQGDGLWVYRLDPAQTTQLLLTLQSWVR